MEIKPEDKISLQSIFNAAHQKFIVEDAPPARGASQHDASSMCRYRTWDGRRCAVGLELVRFEHLLDYTWLEGKSFKRVVLKYPELFCHSIVKDAHNDDFGKLNAFQLRLHDSLCGDRGWEQSVEQRAQCYRKVAEGYGLTVPTGVAQP